MSGTWQHGLFGCFNDLGTCIITYFVPCYTAGKNAEAIGEGCLVHGVYSIVPILGIYCHALIRGKIREQKNIEGTFFHDILLALCCSPCSLVQEAQDFLIDMTFGVVFGAPTMESYVYDFDLQSLFKHKG